MQLNYMMQVILNCIDNEIHDAAVQDCDIVCALVYINKHEVIEYHGINGGKTV